MIAWEDFEKVDIRVGKVLEVEPFAGRHSTHILKIDFGPEIGIKKSLAKLKPRYDGPELIGTQVLGVVNFPPRQIGPHMSETLTLGVPDGGDGIALIRPDARVPEGGRLF